MAIQFTGLASGLDTQSIISDLMKIENLKVERVEKEKTIVEWKKDAWSDINTKLYSFYKKELFDFKSQGTYLQKKVTSSNESIVAVENTNTALVGSHTIDVTQMAKGSYLTGSPMADGTTSATTARDLLGVAATFPKTIGVDIDGAGGLDSVDIEILETDTIDSIVSKFKNSGLDLNASYDSNFNRIFLSTKESGENLQIELSGDSTTLEKLGFSTGNTLGSEGQDAVFDYNGTTLTSATNDINVNGLSLSIRADSGTVNIAATQDTEAIYQKVKDFVLKYNEIKDMFNTKLNADSARGYDPLTAEEKSAMSEDEIKAWETKIKDALLRRDDTLGNMDNLVRSTLTSSIGVDTTGMKYNYLSDLGIVTGSYTEKGLLHIEGDEDDSLFGENENKLRQAIEDNPEDVMEFLSALGSQLYSEMQDKMKSTTLSSSLTFYNDKYMTEQIKDKDDEIKKLEDRLAAIEQRYYKQFAAMEQAMQQSNSTGQWLSQQLSSFN